MNTLTVDELEKRHAVRIAECETHFLYKLAKRPGIEWHGFYLRVAELPEKKNKKRSWRFSHNGRRLSQGPDPTHLQENHPQIFVWAHTAIEAAMTEYREKKTLAENRSGVTVRQSDGGWCVMRGDAVLEDNLSNESAWRVADRYSLRDLDNAGTQHRVSHDAAGLI